jgi:RNA polymerase sigma-70 factor (ECF subfamily)
MLTSDDQVLSSEPRERPAHSDDVLGAALDGDENAFRVVFRELHPRLVRYLRAFVGPDAEDVAAETWSQIARDHRSFHGDYDGFRGWAMTIARNRAIDLLRRRGRRPEAPVPTEEMIDLAGHDRMTAAALDRISADDAVALIATLPQAMAQAVLLRVIVGLDAKEAGRVLGRSPGAVRTAAYRGLRELADRLENPSGVTRAEHDGSHGWGAGH